MKKFFAIALALSLTFLTACSSAPADDGVTRIAIVQQQEHSSLDEIRNAIVARIEAQDPGIQVEYYNGQNDTAMLSQIGAAVAGENYDAVIPIATLAAQYMVTALEGKEVPIVYAAISDPETAGLTGIPNVTGTSDALNAEFILDMMFAADPGIQTVGLLYSNSEPNSEVPIAEAKAYLDARGIPYIEKTGTAADEVIAAAGALVGRVDAVFTPTDNKVMNSAAAVAEIFTAAGIPHYTGADSFVLSGAFAACGVSYTALGEYTAQMALDILNGGEVPEFHVMEGGIVTVNTDTAAALGLDYTAFEAMADQLALVTNQE